MFPLGEGFGCRGQLKQQRTHGCRSCPPPLSSFPRASRWRTSVRDEPCGSVGCQVTEAGSLLPSCKKLGHFPIFLSISIPPSQLPFLLPVTRTVTCFFTPLNNQFPRRHQSCGLPVRLRLRICRIIKERASHPPSRVRPPASSAGLAHIAVNIYYHPRGFPRHPVG